MVIFHSYVDVHQRVHFPYFRCSTWVSQEPNRCFLQPKAESIRHDISIARCMALNSRLTHSFPPWWFRSVGLQNATLSASKVTRSMGAVAIWHFCSNKITIYLSSLNLLEIWGLPCVARRPFASISCRPVKMRVFWRPGQISFEVGYLTFFEV